MRNFHVLQCPSNKECSYGQLPRERDLQRIGQRLECTLFSQGLGEFACINFKAKKPVLHLSIFYNEFTNKFIKRVKCIN